MSDRSETGVEVVWEVADARLDALRDALVDALRRVGRGPYWQEWRADDGSLPARLERVGLALYVDGAKVACFSEAPSIEQLVDLLVDSPQGAAARTAGRWRRSATVVARAAPAFLLAALPKCPMCFVVYASVLGVGANVATAARWLPWLDASFAIALVVGGIGIARTARLARAPIPFAMWTLGAACLVAARAGAGSLAAAAGGGLVLAAAIAHAWLLDPRGHRAAARLR